MGTGFGRSADTGDDLLLRLFNDLYDDYELDHPWLAAKVLSQMFPDEFYPTRKHHRMVLGQQLTKAFPDQLANLSTWQELALPSLLIHLDPEKFAPLDFTDLDAYVERDTETSGDPTNAQNLLLKVQHFAVRWVPRFIDKFVTAELEQQMRALIRSWRLTHSLKKIWPESGNHLDIEWLFDRLMYKLRTSSQGDDDYEDKLTTTTTAAPPQKQSSIKCLWGPILCSLNRVTFQRNMRKRIDAKEVEIQAAATTHKVSRRPKVFPVWPYVLGKRNDMTDDRQPIASSINKMKLPDIWRRLQRRPSLLEKLAWPGKTESDRR